MVPRDPSGDDTLDAREDVPTADTLNPAGALDIDIDRLPAGNARYVVGPLIGKGGMGDVVVANDAQIGREVAIKRMRSRDLGSVTRFLREARIQGRLDHPAIVPVHEVAVDDEGRPYFVMKRLTGTTLADILAKRGHVSLDTTSIDKHPLSRLLRAFSDVCLAVEFAHTRGVVHRDLKPTNIMLGDFGEVYVLDWGVARVMGDDAQDSLEIPVAAAMPGATEAGAVLGTIGYMPPEQLRGLPIDRRADVYALGCILFEILAGSPLHTPGELTSVFEPYDARPSVRAPARDVPPELESLVVRATAPEPEKRPKTARELSERIQRYLDGDRDVALRRRLAREHLAQARAALGDDGPVSLTTSSMMKQPPGEKQRRLVMQHAGRALALDPTTPDAADLVGRIMLEPPRDMPPEVETELSSLDDVNLRAQARIAFLAFLMYIAFIPLMWWVGMRDPLHLSLVAVGGGVNAGLAFTLGRAQREMPPSYFVLILVANVALLFVMARMFTPFLVAPGLACGTMLAFSMHPRFGRTWLLASALSLGVLGPWIVEKLGLAASSATVEAGRLILRSPAGEFVVPNVEYANAVYIIALVFVVGMLVRALAKTQREARVAAHLHAWHLRQLVPVVTDARRDQTPVPS